MKTLFDPEVAAQMNARIRRLQKSSGRLWGTMTAAQALAHCSVSVEAALGETKPPRMFMGRILGKPIKWLALRNDDHIRRNSPTVPEYVVSDERDLEAEQERLCQLVDRFASAGPAGCTSYPHSFFGRLSPEEWSGLLYKHLDHHLRQFSV